MADPVTSVNLHVGHFKTGTSSFQQSMARVRDGLLEAGVCYPPGNERLPHQHGSALRPLVKFGRHTRLDALLEAFGRSGADTLVLSAEAVSAGSPAGIRDLVDVLRRVGPVRVVYSLRDWAGYLPSRYVQNCRTTDGWTWWDFLAASTATFAENADINYALNIEAFVASGADEVRLVHYRPEHAIADLLEAMEIAERAGPLVGLGADEPRLNTSSGSDLVEATRLLNALRGTARGEDLDRLYRAFLQRLPQPDVVYRLVGVAEALLATPHVGAELRALIDATREPPPFLTDRERGEWLATLTRCAATHGLAAPPPDWHTSRPPPAHRPSRATVADLGPALRDELLAALRAADDHGGGGGPST